MIREQLKIGLDQVFVRCVRQAFIPNEAIIRRRTVGRRQRYALGQHSSGNRIRHEVWIQVKTVSRYRLVCHWVADKELPAVVRIRTISSRQLRGTSSQARGWGGRRQVFRKI